jgi:hypothetical protein
LDAASTGTVEADASADAGVDAGVGVLEKRQSLDVTLLSRVRRRNAGGCASPAAGAFAPRLLVLDEVVDEGESEGKLTNEDIEDINLEKDTDDIEDD